MARKANVLLLMSGSIACAKASGLISEWVRRGHAVRVACTRSASGFIGRATLEGLSGHPVFDDTFEPGRAMDHIELARWAELIVACPASANLINKLAAGIADDAVTTLWLAAWGRGAPTFVVPAMNTRMWDYPATRRSVAVLREWGVHLLPAVDGDLACGERGAGRMPEPADILDHIDRLTAFRPGRSRPRVLITGGGTREAIDAVRYIGNLSTGRSAAAIADDFHRAGWEVTWLGARDAVRPVLPVKAETFLAFADLAGALERLLSTSPFDLVVQAAAISDFSVARPAGQAAAGKLSSGTPVTLHLQPNPKLLGRLREWSCSPATVVVGFKLTVGATPGEARKAVARQFRQCAPDAVVHNDLERIAPDAHPFDLYRPGQAARRFANPRELAQGMRELLGETA